MTLLGFLPSAQYFLVFYGLQELPSLFSSPLREHRKIQYEISEAIKFPVLQISQGILKVKTFKFRHEDIMIGGAVWQQAFIEMMLIIIENELSFKVRLESWKHTDLINSLPRLNVRIITM